MTWHASATGSASAVPEARHVVLDTAFGSGAHFLAALARSGAPDALHYIALSPALPPAGPLVHELPELAELWPVDVPGLHRIELPARRVTLDLLLGPIERCLPEIEARVHEFILPEPLAHTRALQRLAAPAATLRCLQPDEEAQRSLRAAGFSAIDDGNEPARGWQRFAYTSRKPQAPRAPAPARRAIVIGAGVAGSAACERLAARGWQVTLVERHAQPAQEASGNRAGIFMPLLSKDDNIPTRLTRAAYLYAIRSWRRLGGLGPIRGEQCGVLQLARDAGHAQLQQEVVEAWRYPEQFVRWLDPDAASAMLGAATPHGAWHFPQGGWATPASVCRAMLHACGDKLRRVFHEEAITLLRQDGEWQALGAGGKLLAAAPTVILANGAGATGIAQAAHLPLYAMRGQVTHLQEGGFPHLNMVVCREAYMTPPVDGIVSVGATYDKAEDRALWQASQDENLARAGEILGRPVGIGAPLQGRVGFRTMAPDRLPLVGALPDDRCAGRAERLRDLARYPGLHTLLGYASRGLIWAPLAAELLACQLEDEPLPIEATLASALDPGRFLLKQRRKL